MGKQSVRSASWECLSSSSGERSGQSGWNAGWLCWPAVVQRRGRSAFRIAARQQISLPAAPVMRLVIYAFEHVRTSATQKSENTENLIHNVQATFDCRNRHSTIVSMQTVITAAAVATLLSHTLQGSRFLRVYMYEYLLEYKYGYS
jgi:hypothetical protein